MMEIEKSEIVEVNAINHQFNVNVKLYCLQQQLDFAML